MPHITEAMHRSVRKRASDAVLNSLLRRDIIGQVDGVKNTFSSWDNCMAKVYCKWPVIIGIVVGSLIIFSVVWCIVRCACCGMSCCCTCFQFLKCCDCCGGCCDGRKNKPMKHLDEPYAPRQGFANQGYQAPPPMMGGGMGTRPEPPKYATFEVGKSGMAVTSNSLSEDALPAMPSWETAAKKHVETEEEKNAVELGELDPTTGQKIPLMAGAASPAIGAPPSPGFDMNASPYGPRPRQGNGANGYLGVAAGDPYAPPNVYNQNGYRGSPSTGPGRGMAGPGRGFDQGRGMGSRGMGGRGRGFESDYQSNRGRGMDATGYGPNTPLDGQGRGFVPSPEDPYVSEDFNGAPVGYGRSQPQRQNSNDTYGSRQYPPQSQLHYAEGTTRPLNHGRQYSDQPYDVDNFQPDRLPRGPSRGPGPRRPGQPYPSDNFRGPPGGLGPSAPARMPSPPLSNNAGFDFGMSSQQQYSRPSAQPEQPIHDSRSYSHQQDDHYGEATAPPSYATRSPPPEDFSYPGYRPYQPQSQRNMTPGGREPGLPQNWDPVHR